MLDESGALTSERFRFRVPYPMTPEDFLGVLDRIASASGPFDRATVGMPGIIRHGRVVHTPHYPTVAGRIRRSIPSYSRSGTGWMSPTNWWICGADRCVSSTTPKSTARQ